MLDVFIVQTLVEKVVQQTVIQLVIQGVKGMHHVMVTVVTLHVYTNAILLLVGVYVDSVVKALHVEQDV